MQFHVFWLGFLALGFTIMAKNEPKKTEIATFAGGCFWCMEPPFEKLDGVSEVITGYMGGTGKNPIYKTYAQQGHIEVIQITFDPQKITYDELLNVFWRQIDPTDGNGQFVDRGPQYRSAIFYHTDAQKKLAELSKEKLQKTSRFSKPIVTEIMPATTFYKAEDYHQNFYKNHSWRYTWYRSGSGRDEFLQKVWHNEVKMKKNTAQATYSKPADEILRKRLTPLQYAVTQQNKTEPPYKNEYWNNTNPGIYVDIVSGEPLFSSLHQYPSDNGWPAFSKPLEPDNIVEKEDRGWFTTHTEVKSKHGDSHLGHVFSDGPPPSGKHYCINSAALRFVPVDDLQEEGYEKYKNLFVLHQ